MHIIITGSLGHISKPLTQALVRQGHEVVVVSSSPEKENEIRTLGATAAIGSVENVDFLTQTFQGANAVYCMIPPNFTEVDQVAYYRRIGANYADAIRQSGIKRIVNLSSYGAHLEKGTGFITGAHHVEQLLNSLPGINVTHIRAGYFYYNLYNFCSMIRKAGFMGANFGGEDRIPLVSPVDIAAAIAEEIVQPVPDKKIVYVVSDDRSCNEVACVLGKAIGMPGLTWQTLTNEQMYNGMIVNGVPVHIASNLVELGAAIHNGVILEDYKKQGTVSGKVKIEDFAVEFLATWQQQTTI